jgi:hypothetical protein
MMRQGEIETRIDTHDAGTQSASNPSSLSFASLAGDLRTVWNASTTDARLKKRIVRTLIHEVIADIDVTAANGDGEIVLVIHWNGGAHTERRLPRRRKGQRNATPVETIEAIRQLTLIAADDLIAGILNRNGLRTGNGNRWTRERVCTTRSYRKIPPFKRSTQGNEPWLNLTKAAAFLTVTPKTLRLAAQAEKIKHLHPLPTARGCSNATIWRE